jgi:muconolactone delta-isomerase
MKIIAIERSLPGATEEGFRECASAEAARAWELYQQGLLRELYFRADRPEAVLVLECADVDSARQTLASLPLVRDGLITFDLIPLAAYPGFARLFNPQLFELLATHKGEDA